MHRVMWHWGWWWRRNWGTRGCIDNMFHNAWGWRRSDNPDTMSPSMNLMPASWHNVHIIGMVTATMILVHSGLTAMVHATLCILLTATMILIMIAATWLCKTSCSTEYKSCHKGKNCSLHNVCPFFMSRGSVNDYTAKIETKHEAHTREKPTSEGIFPIHAGKFRSKNKQ